jgi:hypothetical protein
MEIEITSQPGTSERLLKRVLINGVPAVVFGPQPVLFTKLSIASHGGGDYTISTEFAE